MIFIAIYNMKSVISGIFENSILGTTVFSIYIFASLTVEFFFRFYTYRNYISVVSGKAFEITYVRIKFHSSRPESFAIYKRTSETSPWIPYQFYSASCQETY